MKMQVVIPMSGVGYRFLEAGYTDPKPLIDVGGRPLIAWLLDKFPKDWRFVFICNEEHLKTTKIRSVLKELCPSAVIVGIPQHKRGPVHTVLAGASDIDDRLPTLVNYCDFSFVWDADHFAKWIERTNSDGGIFCYKGFHPHYLENNMYAYCRDEGGRVWEVKEKGHFTNDRTKEYASSGTYYFSSGALVKTYFEKTMAEEPPINGEWYVSMVYNPLIRNGHRVLVYEIPYFLQWGTPTDLEDYLYWHGTFTFYSKNQPATKHRPRLLMPMAGFGSRFEKTHPLPKPMIPVLGTPMFETAKRFLPCRQKDEVVVIRREMEELVSAANPEIRKVVLDAPTQGQAETTLRGLEVFDDQEPVLISACDHGLLWQARAWDDLLSAAPDVVVVGQRHYPGARRTPKSYAYIVAGADGRISRVSVKEPVSPRPAKDLVLVGTFYFKSAGKCREVIQELMRKNIRVNNELYLDSVVNLCVERGWDVRLFEADGFWNWGSPDALQEYSYWHGFFQGSKP